LFRGPHHLEEREEDVRIGVAEKHDGQEGAEAAVEDGGAHVDQGVT
jgi:hypothetical protein